MSLLGGGLILYGGFVTHMATRSTISTEAKWAIGITAICVDAFATLQFMAWRKMK